ncbi:MAG TPA: type IV pilus modification protein PilV [Noviherbaspirillum sp.]
MQSQLTSSAPCKQEDGTSLIEVLVALLIFSLGFLGLAALQARAVQFSTSAEDRSRAALMANELVSSMWIQQSTSLPSEQIDAWKARLGNRAVSGLPHAVGDISAPDSNGTVTITITWHKSTEPDSKYLTQVAIP